MSVTLINPPEQKRVWCGIPKTAAAGVYCFPPLGLMYLQAALERDTAYKAEIFDPTTDNLDYPWIVSSVVIAMSCILVMVTWIGEAIREAFDPRKHTYYE